jgi:membrane fusion protein (multidrug efflux system)
MKQSAARFPASRMILVIGYAFLVVVLLVGCGKGKAPALPTPSVAVTPVIQKDVPVSFEWVSTLDGNVNATIRAQVQGYLMKQLYKEGDFVKQGQVLFEIDPRTFQAAYDEAKAQVAMNQARWEQTKSTLARVKPLAEQRALSQKDLDDAVAAEKMAHASLEAAQAELEKARLNLNFTRITSPIDGIAGIAKAQIGNLISPQSSEELTSVSQVNPIKAYISISEKEYLDAVRYLKGSQKDAKLELLLSDGSVYPDKGSFVTLGRQIDVQTGTMKVVALFPNPDNILRPGQFAKVRAVVATRKNAVLIPQKAVRELQGQLQVGVVNPDKTVDIRTVKTAQKLDDLVIIEEGLKPGELVVVEGTQKLKQGITVNPSPYNEPGKGPQQAPAPSAAPAPAQSGKE